MKDKLIWLLVVLTMQLSACGGGSGGGSAGVDLSVVTGALVFTKENAGRVAADPLFSSEALMRVGDAMIKELVAASQHVGKPANGDCSSFGTWQRTLTDTDSSQTISAGDVLTVTYDSCSRAPLAGSAKGTVVMTLLSVATNGDFTANISLSAPGLGISQQSVATGVAEVIVSGQTRLESVRSDTHNTMVVGGGAGANDKVTLEFRGSKFAAERLHTFRLEKSQRWDQARTSLDLRMKYESPELGGSFDVSTPVPLRAWLDTVPEGGAEQGRIEMRGTAGDLVTVRMVAGFGSSSEIAYEFDQGGKGNIVGSGSARWADIGLTSGFFFADYSSLGRGNTIDYVRSEFSLRHSLRLQGEQAVNEPIRVQFSRTPTDTASWRWQLIDRGSKYSTNTVGVEVPIQIVQQGAYVLIKPLAVLRYSRNYELKLDTGIPTAAGQLLRATSGGSIDLNGGIIHRFPTLDYLSPGIGASFAQFPLVPGLSAQLSGSPQNTGAPAVTYRWTQVNGTPLTFDQPTQRETLVRLAGPGSGIGSATVRLTISLVDGTSESADFTLRTMHDTSGAWVSSLHTPTFIRADSSFPSDPKERVYWGGPNVAALTVTPSAGGLKIVFADKVNLSERYSNWSMDLHSSDGQALQLGRYVNAWGTVTVGRPIAVPSLDFMVDSVVFAPSESQFEIFELEFDASGQVSRLALDFVVRGIADYGPTSGSVRLNSTRPPLP